MIRKRKKIYGFSIIEICIVGVILTVFLVPVFTLMSRGGSRTIHNRNEILAQQYASNIIAYYNVVPFNDEKLAEVDEKDVNELNIELKDDVINIDKTEDNFKRFISIKDFPRTDKRPFNYKIITVKIEWQQLGEKKREFIMSGLVTE